MDDTEKSREQLLSELASLRQQLALQNSAHPAPAHRATQRNQTVTPLPQNGEQNLQLARQYRALFDAIPESLLTFDRQQKVLWANQSANEVFAADGRSLQGLDCCEVLGCSEAECEDCPVSVCLETATAIERDYFTKSGQALILRAFPIRGEGRVVERVVLLAIENSRRLKSRTDAMQAGQLSAIGELAAGIAHEINNPINGILNMAQILCNKQSLEGRLACIPDMLLRESERIARIVASLLNFSRESKRERKLQKLETIIEEMLLLVETQMRVEGIQFSKSIAAGLPAIPVVRQQLEQVLFNLLSNARFALNQGGRKAQRERTIDISLQAAGSDRQQIIICDSGPGVPEPLREQIFSPFFTTKPIGQGSGLGLSICKDIIAEHDGSIWVESEAGQYARFIIELPASPLRSVANS